MRSDRRWIQAQTQIDKANDLVAWRNLGVPWENRQPFVTADSHRRCAKVNSYGARCYLMATHQQDGVRYCRHCKPENAEQL